MPTATPQNPNQPPLSKPHTIEAILSSMLPNLSSHSTPLARLTYLRRICNDLDIRSDVLSYTPTEEQPPPQLTILRKKPAPGPLRPPLKRRISVPKFEPLHEHDPLHTQHKDYDRTTDYRLYIRHTDIPLIVEDWTGEPTSTQTEKQWQEEFHDRARPLLKLSAPLSMPVEESSSLFVHYDIDDLFKEPLALFVGAAWAIPRDGTTVAEPGSLVMVWKALRELERCGIGRRA